MKYDDASWHYGDFPSDLSHENGATHIAMFLAWAITRDLLGEMHLEDPEDRRDAEAVKQRDADPREVFLKWCDEKLTDEDLSEEGNAFASSYYENRYYVDLEETVPYKGNSVYRIENSWENYELMFKVLDRRFEEWRRRVAR
ncbi:MAG TPA: hypothetical protein VF975_07160 [Thermoanaerobaculia bacterium]